MLGRFLIVLGLTGLAVLVSAGNCVAEEPANQDRSTSRQPPPPIWQARAAREAELRRKTVSLDVRDEPLTQVLENVTRQLAIPIRIDTEALQEAKISPEMPITLRLKDVNGHTLLRYLLSGINLRRIAERDGFLVTTPDRVQEIEDRIGPPRRYPVGDLIHDRHGKLDLGGLVHTIRHVTEELSWDSLGGPGRIGYQDEQLLVLQTDAGHAKIEALLRTLRAAKRLQAEKGNATASLNLESNRADSILAAMRTTVVSLPEGELTLAEITRHLTETLDIPFQVSPYVYEDLGRLFDQKFSSQTWQQVSPQQIITDISDRVASDEIGWFVDDETVWMIAESGCGYSHCYPEYHRLYPVTDLVTGGQPVADFNLNPWHLDAANTAAGKPLANDLTDHATQHYQDLLSMLAESVEPGSWEQNGAPGSGWGLPAVDAIVVYQTAKSHEMIEALLAEIRAERQSDTSQTGPTEEPSSPHVIRTYYPKRLGIERKVTRDYLEAVGRRIQQSLDPESWDDGPAFLDVYEGRIVVCHQADRQARIERMIKVCGIIGPDVPQRLITFDRSQDGSYAAP